VASGTDGKGRSVIREVLWKVWEEPGLGHLRLAVRDSGVIADGIALGVAEEGRPFRLAYEVRCDAYWRVRYARLNTGEGGAITYRFVSLDGGFRADLPVDPDGLVLDYPGRFRRVFP
jgi:hypothetical protein